MACIWCKDLEMKLKSLGFSLLESNPGVFLHKSGKGIIAIDTHIDNGTGICLSEEEELDLKTGIQKFYKLKEKDMSKPFKVLRILVTRNTHDGTLKLLQSEYIDTMLQRFELVDCNPVTMLVHKGSHLDKGEVVPFENKKLHQALTRSLTYVAMST